MTNKDRSQPLAGPSLVEPSLPDVIADDAALEELLSRPTPAVVAALARVPGDIVFLGVAGKMGPTLARMAVRASAAAGVKRRVIGVSRFSDPKSESQLQAVGIETVRCDLADPEQTARLPDAPNVVAMSALKFGSTGRKALTWGMNVYVPTLICRRYAGSRIVAFSTGNVYPLTDVRLGGSRETDPVGPVGEYAMSTLGRERIYEYFAECAGSGTSLPRPTPTVIVRLNYACELRYGVLADMARRIYAGEAIDLSMGCVNAIWQGDANAAVLQSLERAAAPAFTFNLAGPETLSVRRLCETLAAGLGKPATFVGEEASDALLSNGQLGHGLFGYPTVPIARLLAWIVDWTLRGGRSLDKPTHFEARDGAY
ncbi:MAG: NAD-dependent epimerase/dehydratase family protein [Planctomycetia bacterium]|nr:NAD-dependent epimerase/dehydratase family protein [Planctomycetia bacterium]